MKTSRKFPPAALVLLEGRIALSHVHALAATVSPPRPPANVAVTLTPGEMVPGAPAAPQGGNTFPLTIGSTLETGLPVYEQRETTYSPAVPPELEDELIVPTGGGVLTTTEWISLKDNGGIEKEVNVETVSGARLIHDITITLPNGTVQTEVQTAISSGITTTHTNVTTAPDGTVSTNDYTDVQQGTTTIITNGLEPGPNGTTETYSGIEYTVGNTTSTIETYDQGGRLLKMTKTTVTSFGDSGYNETIVTTNAHGKKTTTHEFVVVSRLNPPLT